MRSSLLAAIIAVSSLVSPTLIAAPAIEADCEQTKQRRIDDQVAGTSSDRELERARPAPLAVFAAIPTREAQRAAVYGKTAWPAEAAREFAAAAERLRALDPRRVAVELAASDRRAFDRVVQRSRGRVIAIVGHAPDGQFRFLGGTQMAIVDMAAACKARDALCVFLICEAEQLVARQACSAAAHCLPSFERASRAVAHVASAIADRTEVTGTWVQNAIRTSARADNLSLQARAVLDDGVVIAVVDTIHGPGVRNAVSQ